MIKVNLIPNSHRDAKARRARLRRWIAALSVYGAIVLIGLAASQASLAHNQGAVSAQLTRAADDIQQSETTIKSLKADLKDARVLWDANHAVGNQPNWSILLAALGRSIGEDVVLRGCDLTSGDEASAPVQPVFGAPPIAGAPPSANAPAAVPEKAAAPSAGGGHFTLKLAGFGTSQHAVSQFVLRLEQLGLFDRVRLVETRREPFLEADAIAFRVDATIGEAQEAAGKGP
jgi:Tfp pilus assembly protein PilN